MLGSNLLRVTQKIGQSSQCLEACGTLSACSAHKGRCDDEKEMAVTEWQILGLGKAQLIWCATGQLARPFPFGVADEDRS